jgi:hypothetical protein
MAISTQGKIGIALARWADVWRRRYQPGEGTKMLSLVGMVVCIGGALAFGTWHFWPRKTEAGAPVAAAPVSTGGEGMRGGSAASGHSGGGAVGPVLIGPHGEVMFPDAGPGGAVGAGGSAKAAIPPGWRVATPEEAAKAEADVEAIRKAIYDNALSPAYDNAVAPTNDTP